MRWLICGTVPDDRFPLCLGYWKVAGDKLVPADVSPCNAGAEVPSVSILRGTPALVAASVLAMEKLHCPAPLVLLAGDSGNAKGSTALYEFLSSWLKGPESENIAGITFHYLFPSVDGQNRILMALEERQGTKPLLIADAGFMYAAKMSGYAQQYDVFTPDAGELAFLADEKAPHPFYTRGFLLSDDNSPEELASLAWAHGNSAKILLVKGSSDIIFKEGKELGRIENPCIPFMEPVGGTGDLVTGLLTAFSSAGMPLEKACFLAASCARHIGECTRPDPATAIAEFMPHVANGVKITLDKKTDF